MPFPFSIRYNKHLNAPFTPDNQQKALVYIYATIVEKKADNVIVKGNQITYKGATSGGRYTLFNAADHGTFTLIDKDNNWYLVYQISIRSLFFVAITVAGVTAILKWWIGIVYFLFLYGVNCAIHSGRHGDLAHEIAEGIDELLGGTPPRKAEDASKEDGEKLKSWF